MTAEESSKLERVLESMGEMRGEMRGMAASQESVARDIGTMRANIATLASSYQAHGMEIANMRRQCDERHKHDTDEVEKARGLAARMEVVEQHAGRLEKRVDGLEPRFDVTETSVVEAKTERHVLKEERDRLWKRIALLVGVLGSGGIGAVIQYLTSKAGGG